MNTYFFFVPIKISYRADFVDPSYCLKLLCEAVRLLGDFCRRWMQINWFRINVKNGRTGGKKQVKVLEIQYFYIKLQKNTSYSRSVSF